MSDRRKVEIYIRDAKDHSIRVLATNELVPIPEVGEIFTVDHHSFKNTGENRRRYKVLEKNLSYELYEYKPNEAKHGIKVCNVMLKCEKIYEAAD